MASLAWSLVPFAIMIWFGRELRSIASRIRRGKFLGQEIELDELQAKTEAAEATSPMIVLATGSAAGTGSATAEGARMDGAVEDAIEEVLREAGRSPRLGLMLLSAKMERAARDLATHVGLDVSRRPAPLGMLIRALAQAEQLTFEDAEALNLFNHVRNRIVHGHDADDDEVAKGNDFRNSSAQVAVVEAAPGIGERAASGLS